MSPICCTIFGFDIYWYGVAYVVGVLLALWQCRRYAPDLPFDDFVPWAVGGIFLGGRMGYVLLYQWSAFVARPAILLHIRSGGMSFHGGLLGVVLAWLMWPGKPKDSWRFVDTLAAAAPIGLFLGRIANFINGELYGRVTSVPWAIQVGGYFRHPSQLYEAVLEGPILWLILTILYRQVYAGGAVRSKHQDEDAQPSKGLVIAAFMMCYGVFRFVVEFVREPDYWVGSLTPGQLYSVPMVCVGLLLWALILRRARSG